MNEGRRRDDASSTETEEEAVEDLVYSIQLISKNHISRFNISKYFYKISVNKTLEPSMLHGIFDELLLKVEQDCTVTIFKIGTKISFGEHAYPLHIEYRSIDKLNGTLLLNRLSRLSQSNKSILLDQFTCEFTILSPRSNKEKKKIISYY